MTWCLVWLGPVHDKGFHPVLEDDLHFVLVDHHTDKAKPERWMNYCLVLFVCHTRVVREGLSFPSSVFEILPAFLGFPGKRTLSRLHLLYDPCLTFGWQRDLASQGLQ